MGFNQNLISTSPRKSNMCVDQSDLQTRNGDRPKRIFQVKKQNKKGLNEALTWVEQTIRGGAQLPVTTSFLY